MASTMGRAYSLHTPLALSAALQRGAAAVDHPYRPAPFYLLLPMNTQAAWLPDFNLDELPEAQHTAPWAQLKAITRQAAEWIHDAERVIVKVGGGGAMPAQNWRHLLERSGGVLVHTPIATGCIPYAHPQNMSVGGSKGSLCGNYAMENADLLIAVGTRAVCQSDCSRTGYPNVKHVININADLGGCHRITTTPWHWSAICAGTLEKLNQALGHSKQDKERMAGSLCREESSLAGIQS